MAPDNCECKEKIEDTYLGLDLSTQKVSNCNCDHVNAIVRYSVSVTGTDSVFEVILAHASIVRRLPAETMRGSSNVFLQFLFTLRNLMPIPVCPIKISLLLPKISYLLFFVIVGLDKDISGATSKIIKIHMPYLVSF